MSLLNPTLLPQPTTTPACDREDCKATQNSSVDLVQKVQALTDERDLLRRELERRLPVLEVQYQEAVSLLERDELVIQSLTGKVGVTVPSSSWASGCPNCENHRTSFLNLRNFNARTASTLRRDLDFIKNKFAAYEEDIKKERLCNGRLRAHVNYMNTKHAGWEGEMNQALKADLEKMRQRAEAKEKAISEMEDQSQELEEAQQQAHELRKELIRTQAMLKTEQERVKAFENTRPGEMQAFHQSQFKDVEHEYTKRENAQLKRKISDLEEQVALERFEVSKYRPGPSIPPELVDRLGEVISIVVEDLEELEENDLYDRFFATVPANERENIVSRIYEACHPGEKLSARDRNLLLEGGSRVCKMSFNECVKSLGGVYLKRGRYSFWVNVKVRV